MDEQSGSRMRYLLAALFLLVVLAFFIGYYAGFIHGTHEQKETSDYFYNDCFCPNKQTPPVSKVYDAPKLLGLNLSTVTA